MWKLVAQAFHVCLLCVLLGLPIILRGHPLAVAVLRRRVRCDLEVQIGGPFMYAPIASNKVAYGTFKKKWDVLINRHDYYWTFLIPLCTALLGAGPSVLQFFNADKDDMLSVFALITTVYAINALAVLSFFHFYVKKRVITLEYAIAHASKHVTEPSSPWVLLSIPLAITAWTVFFFFLTLLIYLLRMGTEITPVVTVRACMVVKCLILTVFGADIFVLVWVHQVLSAYGPAPY